MLIKLAPEVSCSFVESGERGVLKTKSDPASASLHSCQKPSEQEIRWSEGKFLLSHFTFPPTT